MKSKLIQIVLYDKNAPLNAAFVFQHAQIFSRERIEEMGHLRSKRMSRSESYHAQALLKFLSLNI